MRTRLDEIVEEIYAAWPGMLSINEIRPIVERGVNNAFRHGVEQHRAAINLCNKVMAEAGVRLVMGDEAVQPAPAGEKDREFISNETACSGSHWVDSHGLCHHPDRRKGERRKEQFWVQVWSDEKRGDGYIGRYEQRKYPYPDRRSGVDRRSTSPSTGGKDRRKG